MPASLINAWRWAIGQGWLMLTLTSLFWAGNVVAGRLAVGEVSPMAITCLRWLISAALLLAIQRRTLAAEWPKIAPRWRTLLWMGCFGYTGFNALFYLAAHHTLGVNLAIIQGSLPIFVLAGGVAFMGARINLWQAAGFAMTVAGVVAVAARGDLGVLATLGFNLAACFVYAIYTLALPDRPQVSALSFLTALACAAALSSIPVYAVEIALGQGQWPTPRGWLIIAYIALFPSLLAQLCFLRGVELIGPSRAGVFTNLVPVIGALFSVAFLHEAFGLYHAVSLAFVVGGIFMVERFAPARPVITLDQGRQSVKAV
jgi:drug/metabolite transporter (DMT)-like permease